MSGAILPVAMIVAFFPKELLELWTQNPELCTVQLPFSGIGTLAYHHAWTYQYPLRHAACTWMDELKPLPKYFWLVLWLLPLVSSPIQKDRHCGRGPSHGR